MPSEFAYFVPMLAARTLKATGRNEQALQLLNAILNTQPGNDDPYEVIVATEKTRALTTLEQLFSRDMFEERPLIWKAQVLKDANRLEEAEQTARLAIAIDPSDGEQGPGRRMRVYAVLADIREARGDKKEAEFLRGAVKAVRTAEQADRIHEAGLISRAVKMYQESLHFFTDAYCIQSRLAVHLAELGRHAEAEEHYRRAYELMPDSFGRVESHCFGCEHVFEGERAQTLAERVFSQIAAKNPKKPQVHYLLGTLRQQQERLTDALKHFDDATTLDPDYLNAWVKLQTVANRLRTAPAKRDAAALNVLRLDPLQRHASPDLENISDLRALWSAAERAQKLRPNVSTNLYPLRASAAELDKIKQRPGREMFIDYMPMNETPSPSPGDILAKTAWLHTVGELLDMSRSTMGL